MTPVTPVSCNTKVKSVEISFAISLGDAKSQPLPFNDRFRFIEVVKLAKNDDF